MSTAHTPGPWTWHDTNGAGLQISAILPAGFNFSGIGREADGKTSFMVWTIRDAYTVQIADERWVQFSTGSWSEMQRANARLIAAAPDMLDALHTARITIGSYIGAGLKDPATLRAFEAVKVAIAKAAP